MTVRIMVGDALSQLAKLPDGSVHWVVTSPPYWGLRAYKGEPGMIGLEPTFDEHLDNLVAVFREVRRVLRKDGTCWVNYSDSYWAGGPNNFGWKAKDLMGMPGLVSTALMKDGYYRRSEIIWHKPNPMPESCRDRPTSSHEKLFLLTEAARYFYDAEAVRVPKSPISLALDKRGRGWVPTAGEVPPGPGNPEAHHSGLDGQTGTHANLRNVWTIATHAFNGWTETVDLVPLSDSQAQEHAASGSAGGGDMCRITSPNCPEHGGLPDLVPTGFCDGLPDRLLSRMRDSGSHPGREQGRADGDGGQSHDHCPSDRSMPDCSDPSGAPSATPHSTDKRDQ